MTEKVYVTIKGLQFASEDSDVIEIINIGKYSEINDKIYIKYDDVVEGETKISSNLIKISKECVEITKKGPITAHMSFIPNEKTMTYYETPFGSLYLGVFARSVEINRNDTEISVDIDYSLEVNYEEVSECKVNIKVTSQGNKVELV